MITTISRLISLEPPPHIPTGGVTNDSLIAIETQLGFRFPNDYKEYISMYGAGEWFEFLGIATPCNKIEDNHHFTHWINHRLDGLDEFHIEFPEFAPPFFRYPAPNGLIPIGFTVNGGTICWQVRPNQIAWSIVLLGGKFSNGFDIYEMSLTDFLLELITEQIRPTTFPGDFFPFPRPAFKPCPEKSVSNA